MTRLWQGIDHPVVVSKVGLLPGGDRVVTGRWQGGDRVVTGWWLPCQKVVITTTLQGCNKLGISKWERKFSDTNFEIGKPCWHFDWMLQSSSGQKTKAFSQNVCTVFWSQSWYQRTLLSISAGDNREAITRNFYMGILKTIIPLPSLSSHSSLSALGILLEITVCLFKMEDMLSSHSVGHIWRL